jgi:molecular chaperone DnaJ
MNPYQVLGVPEGADEETIKKAYRDLVKKYHPDKYINNPLSDLASEKLKAINEAYDMLMNKQSTSSSTGYESTYSSYTGGGSHQTSGETSFQTVRVLISQRRFDEAEHMLLSLDRGAEWNYLMGVIYINRGWYDKGRSYIQTAVNMDPNNPEYRAAMNQFQNRNTQYRNVGNNVGGCMMSPCDCCTNLICADCCCECMGGDLIPCC